MSDSVPAEADVLAQFELTGDRLRVAQSNDSHIVVLAGPGAGKTHVLVAHACWLAHHHAGRVIMLTFTKKAAREMERRVGQALSPMEARRVVPSTVHSYAMSLLNAHGHWIGLPRQLQQIDGREVQEIADEVAASSGVPRMSDFSQRFERYQRLAGNIAAAGAPPLLPLVVAEMRRAGTFDWETCIRFATQLLDDHREVRDSVRHHDRFVLLDEAQDCDPAQLAFVDSIVGGPEGTGHLLVAMDPDQSLYAFRQADPDRVRAWAATYAPVPVELSENYRCQPRIQALAKKVLGRTWEGVLTGGRTTLYAARDLQDEAHFVHTQIRERMEGPRRVDSARIAILGRRRTRLATVDALLRTEGIPIRADPQATWDDREGDVLLALTFLAEWRDGTTVSRTAQAFLQRLIGLAPSAARELEAKCLASGAHPGDVVEHAGWHDLRAWVDGTRRTPLEIVRRTADALRVELEDASSLFVTAGQARTFAELLRTAHLGPPASGSPSQAGVLITTFHGAKGLEFDTVFVVGCEDGVVPDFRAKGEDGLREERRALYVAVTRAELEVIASWVREGPAGRHQVLSRFLPAVDDPAWGGD